MLALPGDLMGIANPTIVVHQGGIPALA
jgi:hypothetical protein